LIADVEAALVQKIFNIAKRMREPDIEHHRQADDLGRRCWQTNANSPLQGQGHCPLYGTKAAPLGESGGAVQLENGARGEVAFLVEEVVDRGVDGSE
jgi:hypothetical protein